MEHHMEVLCRQRREVAHHQVCTGSPLDHDFARALYVRGGSEGMFPRPQVLRGILQACRWLVWILARGRGGEPRESPLDRLERCKEGRERDRMVKHLILDYDLIY